MSRIYKATIGGIDMLGVPPYKKMCCNGCAYSVYSADSDDNQFAFNDEEALRAFRTSFNTTDGVPGCPGSVLSGREIFVGLNRGCYEERAGQHFAKGRHVIFVRDTPENRVLHLARAMEGK